MAKKNSPPPNNASQDAAERYPVDPLVDLSEADRLRLAQALMRRQFALSLRVFLVFAVLLFGLPLVNWLMPQVAQARVGGFTLTWLFLGVLFYPLTWALSGYFIKASDRIEHELTQEHGQFGRKTVTGGDR